MRKAVMMKMRVRRDDMDMLLDEVTC